jgi:ABC-type transporter Mla subunit MlaD
MLSSSRTNFIVGTIMLLVLAGLVGGLLLLGNRTFSAGYVISVDFNSLGNLKEGADVRISHLRVGRVLVIRQAVGVTETPLGAQTRVQLWIERDLGRFIYRNSIFYINARGVIGERYLEVGPPTGDPAAPATAGDVFRGTDPPALDRFVQYSYINLTTMLDVMHTLSPLVVQLTRARERLQTFFEQTIPPGQLAHLQQGIPETLQEAQALYSDLLTGTDDLRLWRRVSTDLDSLFQTDQSQSQPLGQHIAQISQQVEELQSLLSPADRRRLTRAMNQFQQAARDGVSLATVVRVMVERVQQGHGTLGRLLTDPTLIDEIKEAHRLLKESPWRALAQPPQDHAPRGVPLKRGSP